METALVSIIMGSTSDWQIMRKAAIFLDEMNIKFEINALSAHRTPKQVLEYAENAQKRGIKVIIAGAGMAAALPGVIASSTTLPVIGVPISSTLQGIDAVMSIMQMPPQVSVATMAIDGALNAAVLAAQILALSDEKLQVRLQDYKTSLQDKIVKANEDLKQEKFKNRVN